MQQQTVDSSFKMYPECYRFSLLCPNALVQAESSLCLDQSLLTSLPASTPVFLYTVRNTVARAFMNKIKYYVTLLLKPLLFVGSKSQFLPLRGLRQSRPWVHQGRCFLRALRVLLPCPHSRCCESHILTPLATQGHLWLWGLFCYRPGIRTSSPRVSLPEGCSLTLKLCSAWPGRDPPPMEGQYRSLGPFPGVFLRVPSGVWTSDAHSGNSIISTDFVFLF